MNLPNALTIGRLLLVPVFAVLLLWDSGQNPTTRGWAAAVFVLASVTDLVDGHIARQRGQVTVFGTVVDPIADKVLTGVALIGLSILDALPWWVTIVILAREIGVTLMRLWVLRDGVIPASRGGKAKTLSLTVAITLYLLPLEGPALWAPVVIMGIAVVLTVATGVDYAVRAVRVRRSAGAVDVDTAALVAELARRGITLGVAESLTGGLLAASFVSVPGASSVFRGGITAYATQAKVDLLGVDPALLDREGPVHPEVAAQMAQGARTRLGADYGIATTGVAGPGPQDGHSPGVVCLGVSGPRGVRGIEIRVPGDRAEVRRGAVAAALVMLGEEVRASSRSTDEAG
jgi:CDP-diacylglycerol---glycerol-3-phosphate 3-phosphatidyltransferase